MIKMEIYEDGVAFSDDESYKIDERFLLKLVGIAKKVNRVKPKQDALFINEGKEGWGKTNSSIFEAAVLKELTHRPIFLGFHLQTVREWASTHEDWIIIWDEPGLDSLSSDQVTNLNKDMQRFFMMGRKKGHIYLLNWTRFWKFNEYLATDRGDGMIHMSNRMIGHFVYIPRKNFEKLWKDKKTKNQRNYNQYKRYGAYIPEVMEAHFDELDITIEGKPHCTYKDYSDFKDKSINDIGQEKKNKTLIKTEEKLKKLRYQISQIKSIPQRELAKLLEVEPRRLREWKNQEWAGGVSQWK